jgi:hypothetical protein
VLWYNIFLLPTISFLVFAPISSFVINNNQDALAVATTTVSMVSGSDSADNQEFYDPGPTILPEETSNKTNNQISTASFVTYSNYACGVEMQYPSYWTKINASEEERDGGTIVYFSPPGGLAYLSLGMTDVPSTRTLRGPTIQTIDNFEQIESNFTLMESNSTYIGNHPAHQIIYTSTLETDTGQTELYRSFVTWTIEDDRAYKFRFDSNNFSTFDNYLPDAIDIINSTQITTPGEDISEDYTVIC